MPVSRSPDGLRAGDDVAPPLGLRTPACGWGSAVVEPSRLFRQDLVGSAGAGRGPVSRRLGGRQRRAPDLVGVFADRAVGREPADPRGVEDARAPPGAGLSPEV